MYKKNPKIYIFCISWLFNHRFLTQQVVDICNFIFFSPLTPDLHMYAINMINKTIHLKVLLWLNFEWTFLPIKYIQKCMYWLNYLAKILYICTMYSVCYLIKFWSEYCTMHIIFLWYFLIIYRENTCTQMY